MEWRLETFIFNRSLYIEPTLIIILSCKCFSCPRNRVLHCSQNHWFVEDYITSMLYSQTVLIQAAPRSNNPPAKRDQQQEVQETVLTLDPFWRLSCKRLTVNSGPTAFVSICRLMTSLVRVDSWSTSWDPAAITSRSIFLPFSSNVTGWRVSSSFTSTPAENKNSSKVVQHSPP